MYYRLIAGQDIFELNPGLRAVPLFKDLTDMQMKYVCLVCDPSHDNPVKTLQGKERREQSARLAGYKIEVARNRLDKQGRDIVAGHNDSIENGIIEFKKLHYDDRIDLYETLVNQIGEIRDFMKERKGDPKKLRQALDLGVKLPGLVEAKQKIEQLLNVETTIKPQLDGEAQVVTQPNSESSDADEELSTLDAYMLKHKPKVN